MGSGECSGGAGVEGEGQRLAGGPEDAEHDVQLTLLVLLGDGHSVLLDYLRNTQIVAYRH